MIYVSSDVVLADTSGDGRPNAPLVGYRTLLTNVNVSSDEAAAGFPVTNVTNTSTAERWKGETTDLQYVTASLAESGLADYVGIAGHNFGTAQITVQVQTSDDGVAWTDLGDDFLPGDDAAIMARFPLTDSQWFRLKLTPGLAAPQIAVLYLGRLLVLQRNIQRGYSPMPYDYSNVVTVGISESGQYLGSIARRASPQSDVPQKNLTPSWFRENLAPFFARCSGTSAQREPVPFFFAWRPTAYPMEVAFGWFPEGSKPSMSNAGPKGLIDASFSIQGLL